MVLYDLNKFHRIKKLVRSITLVNNTQKIEYVYCDSGKMWFIQNMRVVNCDSVARTIEVKLWDEHDNCLMYVGDYLLELVRSLIFHMMLV